MGTQVFTGNDDIGYRLARLKRGLGLGLFFPNPQEKAIGWHHAPIKLRLDGHESWEAGWFIREPKKNQGRGICKIESK